MRVENPLYKLERILIEEEKNANQLELNESVRSDNALLLPKNEIMRKSKKQTIEEVIEEEVKEVK